MTGHDIIVIGASAGGVEALKLLVSQLPADLPAAIFIVLHIPAHGGSALPTILERAGVLPVEHAKDGHAIQNGHIYVAPPDAHLLVKRGYMVLSHGPKENGHRPAADPLFRSAARAYGERVIGIILSGVLDDGTAGIIAVKMREGIAIVQDPKDAMYSGMPTSAIENAQIDHIVPVIEISALLSKLTRQPILGQDDPVSDDLDKEVNMAEFEHNTYPPGKLVALSCPDCGGPLWEVQEGELIRFRCRVGHAFTAQSLLAHQSEQLEDAFWMALRALEESAALSRRMAERAETRGKEMTAAQFRERATNADERARLIREVLQSGIIGTNDKQNLDN
ncbi:MAG: chemotaxis protein CheB [Anaerolineae bacterium]|nr:chemotaxis protein CheB [Anaerolineae bacterium]